jgi:hypothetical protein
LKKHRLKRAVDELLRDNRTILHIFNAKIAHISQDRGNRIATIDKCLDGTLSTLDTLVRYEKLG